MPKDKKKRQSNSPKDKNTKKDIKSKDDKSGKKKPASPPYLTGQKGGGIVNALPKFQQALTMGQKTG